MLDGCEVARVAIIFEVICESSHLLRDVVVLIVLIQYCKYRDCAGTRWNRGW